MKQRDVDVAFDGSVSPKDHVPHPLQKYLDLLRNTFGFQGFRSHQEDVLTAMDQGSDCLAVLPTGSGKSLCFVLPALSREGLTLVISPLIALIRDQVQRYKALGVPCAALDSLQTQEEKRDVWERLANRSLKLLFVSPERLASKDFRDRLKMHARLSLVAVDEAHCISQWGNQFRPEYRKITQYLQDFPPVQKIALTATATAKVRRDIILGLRLVEPCFIHADPVRDNLRVRIFRLSKVEEQLTGILNSVQTTAGQGIVYATTRRGVGEIAQMLARAGEKVCQYHAGLTNDERQANQDAFAKNQSRVMVATNAFGMGIDKRDIRFVFHAGMPASLEAYIQEIGRAGRDGHDAKCYLFYSGRDVHIQKFLIDKSFPEKKFLKEVLDKLQKFAPAQPYVSEAQVLQHIMQGASFGRDELLLVLKTLFREGVLVKRTIWDESGERNYVQKQDVPESLDNFVDEVQARKQEQLAKLAIMSQFVMNDVERDAIMHRYFEY